MFIKNRRFKKFMAIFFLATMVYEIGFPVAAYALTAGPTAPEATSFEPVDTTDIVNMQTGDFNYNIPLLEVPGPEGGYPLGLSYHAGIQPNEEASWVGLGWTLNPGAITRTVNGFADDWNNQSIFKKDYWSGTEGRAIGVDIGVGLGPATVSTGMTFTSNNNKGFSVDMKSVKLSFSPEKAFGLINSGLNAMASASGNPEVGIITPTKEEQEAETHFKHPTTPKQLAATKSSRESSNGISGFAASVNSNTAGRIKSITESGGIGFKFGILNVGLSYAYYRTWSDEMATIASFGSLYQKEGLVTNDFAGKTFDTYHMVDFNNTTMFDAPDAEYQLGGSMHDYDSYTVNAQGLNGPIRPYNYQADVVGLNRGVPLYKGSSVIVAAGGANASYPTQAPITYKIPSGIQPYGILKPTFRFVDDFSNQYRQNLTNFTDGSLSVNFDQNPVTGDGIIAGYAPGTNYLEGSKHIEYFTNADIVAGTAKTKGFIDASTANSKGQSRSSNSLIGGYSITAENGTTYHFAVAAYNTDGITYNEKIKANSSDPDQWSKTYRYPFYAYTWYLTSVTGADFVDRNNDGYADENDWGYYVNFGYGLWEGSYNWRNPSEGFTTDLDNEFQEYSHGQKGLYYLNSIQTRTHTAIFEKDIRQDGRAIAQSYSTAATPYLGDFTASSRKVLRLNRILLLNNSDAATVDPTRGTTLNSPSNGQNVIDVYDLAGTNIESKAIKIISFNHDYTLSQKTSNSFVDASPTVKTGKLTLQSIQTLGKGGVRMVPPVNFGYNYAFADAKIFVGTFNPYDVTNKMFQLTVTHSLVGNAAPYNIGDLVSFTVNGIQYNGIVKTVTTPGLETAWYVFGIKWVGDMPAGLATQTLTVGNTKNPVYDKDAYDKWGLYKCDYDLNAIKENQNIGRLTSAVSALHTDAWSLRSIGTQLGSTINVVYESDRYARSAIDNRSSLLAGNFAIDAANKFISFTVGNYLGLPLSSVFAIGSRIDMTLVQRNYSATTGNLLSSPFITSTADSLIYYTVGNFYYSTTSKMYSDYRKTLTKPTTGEFTIQSIDDAANKITIKCSDPFIISSQAATLTWPDGTNYSIYLENKFIGGNVYFYRNLDPAYVNYGGGTRVKEIHTDFDAKTSLIKYAYNLPNSTVSSGVTSYEPNTINKYLYDATLFNGLEETFGKVSFKKDYRKYLNKTSTKITALSRYLPAPGVIYEYVSVSNAMVDQTNHDAPGKVTYQFTVPDDKMVRFSQLGQYSNSLKTIQTKNITINDNSASVGTLKREIEYDNLGNKLTETIHRSLSDESETAMEADYGTKYGYRGRVVERTANARMIGTAGNSTTSDLVVTTARVETPYVSTGKTTINYITGKRESVDYLAYDFYSGALIRSVETDAYGNRIMTETKPAYRQYTAMGLKVNAIANKHMLTQEAGTYTYKVDANNAKTGLVNASTQTWSNALSVLLPDNSGSTTIQDGSTTTDGNVWRKQLSYIWQLTGSTTDGLTPVASFVDLNWASPTASNAAWKLNTTTTLYDVYSHELEATDLNNLYSATRMGYKESRVLISGGPSKRKQLVFSGAEDDLINGKFGGQVSPGNGTVQTSATFPVTTAHTGYNSLKVGAGVSGFGYSTSLLVSEAQEGYIASVWVKSTTGVVPVAALNYNMAVIGGSIGSGSATVVATRKAGDWYLLSIVIPPVTQVTSGQPIFSVTCLNTGTSDVYFDDFKVQPLNSSTTAYVYDKLTGEVTYILNNQDLFTRYEYDAMGRLIATYKETLGNGVFKTSEKQYNYGIFQP